MKDNGTKYPETDTKVMFGHSELAFLLGYDPFLIYFNHKEGFHECNYENIYSEENVNALLVYYHFKKVLN